MSRSNNSIVDSYKACWRSLRHNWKVLLLTFFANILLAFVAIGPVSNLLAMSIGRTTLGDKLATSFDYTLITDIIRHEESAFNISLAAIGSFVILYLPWSVFYQGGYIAMIKRDSNPKGELKDFWRGGAEYFFRYLRLTAYVLGFTLILLSILSRLLLNKVQPFELDSEQPLMVQFWVSLAIFMVVVFITGIFKELAKVFIANSDKSIITAANTQALKTTLKRKAIGLSLLNILVLLGATLIYFVLRKAIGSYLIPAIIVGQLFLLFRLAYKFVRLASFYHYFDSEQLYE